MDVHFGFSKYYRRFFTTIGNLCDDCKGIANSGEIKKRNDGEVICDLIQKIRSTSRSKTSHMVYHLPFAFESSSNVLQVVRVNREL